jgi:hypothetical protein
LNIEYHSIITISNPVLTNVELQAVPFSSHMSEGQVEYLFRTILTEQGKSN